MTCSKPAKRKRYKPRPGWLAAAEKLGVTYTHLRLVLVGQRKSKVLVKRFELLKKGKLPVATGSQGEKQNRYHNSPGVLPPDISRAAADNLSPEFFATLAKLGLQVVIVRFEAGKDSPIWRHPQLELDLGAALVAAEAGNYDSSCYISGNFLHFFHVANLAKAMATLKASIDSRNLLAVTTILHGESNIELRIWYPPTAELVTNKTP